MNKIEKIRQEIERRMHICDGVFERDSDTYYQGKAVAYQETLSFIDSLRQEEEWEGQRTWIGQPYVSLEKEYEEYVDKDPVFGKLINHFAGIIVARHFYELGKKSK